MKITRGRLRQILGVAAIVLASTLVVLTLAGDRLTRRLLVSDGLGVLGRSSWERASRFAWTELGPLPETVNGPESVAAPAFAHSSPDLYFARKTTESGWELYSARWSPSGYEEPQPLFELNSSAHDLDPMPVSGGRALMFASNREGGRGGYDLYIAERRADGFAPPRPLGSPINSEADERHPTIDAIGRTFVFSSNRLATDGFRHDLYQAQWHRGSPSDPALITALCAGDDSESRAPALSPDGRFLVFASDRRGGAGGYDLYRSVLHEGNWEPPEALTELNTEHDESDPVLSSEGTRLLFARSRDSGIGLDQSIVLAELRELVRLTRPGDEIWSQVMAILALVLLVLLLSWLYFQWNTLHPFIKFIIVSVIVHILVLLYIHSRAPPEITVSGQGDRAFSVSYLRGSEDPSSASTGPTAATGEYVESERKDAASVAREARMAENEAPAAPLAAPPATDTLESPHRAPASEPLPAAERRGAATHHASARLATSSLEAQDREAVKNAQDEAAISKIPEARAVATPPQGAAVDASLSAMLSRTDAPALSAPAQSSNEAPIPDRRGAVHLVAETPQATRSARSGRSPATPRASLGHVALEGDRKNALEEAQESAAPGAEALASHAPSRDARSALNSVLESDGMSKNASSALETEATSLLVSRWSHHRSSLADAPTIPPSESLGSSAPASLATSPATKAHVAASGKTGDENSESTPALADAAHDVPPPRDVIPTGIGARPEIASAGAIAQSRSSEARELIEPRGQRAIDDAPTEIIGTAVAERIASAPSSPLARSARDGELEGAETADAATTARAPVPKEQPLEMPSRLNGTSAIGETASRLPDTRSRTGGLADARETLNARDVQVDAASFESNRLASESGRSATPPRHSRALAQEPATFGPALPDGFPLGEPAPRSFEPATRTHVTALPASRFGGTLNPHSALQAGGDLGAADLLLSRQSSVARETATSSAGIYAQRQGRARLDAIKRGGGSAETEAAVLAGLRYLKARQRPTGAWGARSSHEKYGDFRVGKSGLALLAFLGSGHTQADPGEFQETVAKALRFLIDLQDAASGHVGDSDAYGHGIAAYALAEAYAMTQDSELRRPLRRAIDRIVRAQFIEGGEQSKGGWSYYYRDARRRFDAWPRLSITVWQLMALKSAGLGGIEVPEAVFDRARSYVLACHDRELAAFRYNHDPGWLASAYPTLPGSNSAALFALELLAVPAEDQRVKTAVDYVTARPPATRWRRYPDRDFAIHGLGNLYYLYYATLGLFFRGGPEWESWNARMTDLLVKGQDRDGSWQPISYYASYAGDTDRDRCYTTALSVLTLEVYYRYFTPLLSAVAHEAGSK